MLVGAVLARVVRVVFAFGVIVGTLFHTLASVLLTFQRDFFSANLMPSAERHLVLGLVLGSAVLAIGWGTVLVAKDPERSVPALEWWVGLCCPIIVLPILVALLHHSMAADVETALLLTLFVIAFERLMRVSLGAWDARPPLSARVQFLTSGLHSLVTRFFSNPRATFAALLILATAQTVFLAVWAVWAHQRFATYAMDLGDYDSVFACTLHGRWLAMPPMGLSANWSDLTSNHADLAVFYLLPIYALRPVATTLLLIQAVFIGATTIPLYLFARSRLSIPIAFAVGLAWLLYAPMQSAQFYDYHPQHIAAAFVICAIASVEYRKWVLFWVFFALAILTREDVSIGLTALGLFLLLSGHRPKTGIAAVVIATVYFVSLRFFLMTNTSFAGMYKNLYAPDEAQGFGSILATLVSNPGYVGVSLLKWEKARYVAQIFAPLAFLPMRRPLLWILMLPGFFVTLLSTEYMPTIQISFQYVANWAAYMFPAAVIVLGLYGTTAEGQLKRRAATIAMLCASLVATIQWGAYSPRGSIRGGFGDVPFKAPSAEDRQRERDLQEVIKKVPSTVKLCTSDRVMSHTTSVILENWPLGWGAAGCDYLLWSDLPGDVGVAQGQGALAGGDFELVERRGGITLAKKKPKVEVPPAGGADQPAVP
ncbi:MAG: hypothetical protein H6Q89_2138 [Myxococcaceae bacterium]|nr:hypothetical protein [Myxococcaceae bacterium]